MISLIVAIAKNNVIGKNNDLPWHYPEDLKHFKETTSGKTVLMGYNTYQSILKRLGKPLPNRKSIVLTSREIDEPGVIVVRDIFKFIHSLPDEDLFVIGGRQVFNLFLDLVDRLYITHIEKEYDGDIFFPEINFDDYEQISERRSGELRFCIYERKKKT